MKKSVCPHWNWYERNTACVTLRVVCFNFSFFRTGMKLLEPKCHCLVSSLSLADIYHLHRIRDGLFPWNGVWYGSRPELAIGWAFGFWFSWTCVDACGRCWLSVWPLIMASHCCRSKVSPRRPDWLLQTWGTSFPPFPLSPQHGLLPACSVWSCDRTHPFLALLENDDQC